MKLAILSLIMMFTFVMTAQALTLCQDEVPAWQNCTVVTPPISCASPTYEILNQTGQQIETGTMTEWNETKYEFNFSQSQGTYVIMLCDGTFRQIKVTYGSDEDMISAALIIVPMLLGLILLAGAATLGRQHTPLKVFLFLMSVLPFFASMHFGLVAVIKFFDWPEMQDAIASTLWWVGISFAVIVIYWFIYWLYSLAQNMKEKERRRLEY